MLEATAISVTIEGNAILRDVDITAHAGETVVVLGPSGSGKSTLLRVVAGLQVADAGTVSWSDDDLTAAPPHRRGFGLMFQDLALFPHRSVAGNVAFGLEMNRSQDIADAVAAALDLVGLAELGGRQVDTLSGGEQQRVALARALAPQPRLLMLDEPLGSLDRILRERLTADLRSIFDGLDTAVLYVTHDQDEALAIADRVVILDEGRVVQAGTPEEVWLQPATGFVARFLGWTTFADVDVVAGRAATPWGSVTAAAGGPTTAALRPGSATIDPGGPLLATVAASDFTGSAFVVTLQPEAGAAVEATSPHSLPIGSVVRWSVDPFGIVVMPKG